MNISDKLEELIREIKVKGFTPHIIVMNRKHMKKLQKELETNKEILTYKGIQIEVAFPCHPVENITIIDKESWIKCIQLICEHINCRCRIKPLG